MLVPRLPRPAPADAGEAGLAARRLAAAASTLDERLCGIYEPASDIDPAAAEARLARWRERLAAGGDGAFERRLRWDGWTIDGVCAALGAVRLRDDAPLPAWAEVAGEVLRALRSAADGPAFGDGADDADGDAAGIDALLLPLVAVARRRLEAMRLPGAGLSAGARRDLEAALLRSLSADFAETLAVERAAFRAARQAVGDAEAAFVARMRNGGMESLLLRYPVLARMAATRVSHWVDAAAELVRRLAADRAELRRSFGGGARLGEVVSIAAGLSDPHRGGRAVMALTFASGARVVYKPRTLAIDAAFRRLVAWIGADGGPRLRVPRVVDRGAYGWAEHMAPRACRTEAQVERFHERAGMLLCLAWLLGGSDHHAENLVARGAHPIPVDLEVVFGTPLESAEGDDFDVAAAYATWDSVLRTHLLPHWRPGDPARLEGGLMCSVDGDATRSPSTEASVDGHADALLAGFARMYRLLLRRRDALLAADGPLHAFAACPVRAVLRHTRVYASLLARLRHPRFLADGADRSLELEVLCGPMPRASAQPAGWAAFRAERRDLEAQDVPVFTARADSTELRGSRGEPAPGVRRVPGLGEAIRRLREMDEHGLALQSDLVRISLLRRTPPGEAARLDGGDGLSPAAALGEAAAIADRLAATARSIDGGVRWITVRASADVRAARFGYTDLSLAGGAAGIALFLAACARATGSAAHAELALRTIQPVIDGGAAAGRETIDREEVGGLIVALRRIGALLDRAEPIAAAERLASRAAAADVDPTGGGFRRLDADDRPARGRDCLDGGGFGAIDGLLAGGRVDAARARAAEALRRARRRGFYALGTDDAFAPGLFHGVAGVGYTLLRLHAPERLPSVLPWA